MKNYTVIAYDIVHDKKRQRIAGLLEQYGRRVNYSVFECMLTKKDMERVRKEIGAIIDKRKDTVIYYTLCRDCFSKTIIDGESGADINVVESI